MSIEQALLARTQPYMLAAKVRDVLRAEVHKGCLPDLAPEPVALEPCYLSVLSGHGSSSEAGDVLYVPEGPLPETEALYRKIIE